MPVLPSCTVLACVIVPAVTFKLPRAPDAPTVLLKETVFEPTLMVRLGLLGPLSVLPKVSEPVVRVIGELFSCTKAGSERAVLFVVMLPPMLMALGVLENKILLAKIAAVVETGPVV